MKLGTDVTAAGGKNGGIYYKRLGYPKRQQHRRVVVGERVRDFPRRLTGEFRRRQTVFTRRQYRRDRECADGGVATEPLGEAAYRVPVSIAGNPYDFQPADGVVNALPPVPREKQDARNKSEDAGRAPQEAEPLPAG